jgi:hypothetical protein
MRKKKWFSWMVLLVGTLVFMVGGCGGGSSGNGGIDDDPTPPSDSVSWDGTADTSWYDSTQTSFTITEAEQLAGLATLTNAENTFLNRTITLAVDIDLDGSEWVPIRRFDGTFDGGGHTISNLTIIQPKTNASGLFGVTFDNSVVKNVHLTGVNVTTSSDNLDSFAGGVTGDKRGAVTGCTVSGSVTASATASSPVINPASAYAGGIIGRNSGYNSGYNSGTVTGCDASGSVTASASGYGSCAFAGGVIGWSGNGNQQVQSVTVTDCTSSSTSLSLGIHPHSTGMRAPSAGMRALRRSPGLRRLTWTR